MKAPALRRSFVSLSGLSCLLAGMLLPLTFGGAARADEKFDQELKKAIESYVSRRIAELEKSLKEKDTRIAELEKKLAELSKAREPAAPKAAKPTNAFLGVGHIDHDKGALITTVHDGSPAAKAGLSPNDIIVAIDGQAVTSAKLGGAITSKNPGSDVKVTYLRGNDKKDATLKLVDRTKFFAARAAEPAKEEAVVLGVTVEEAEGGLAVHDVEDGYTGKVAGLQKGDRILKVNGAEVKTIEQISAAIKKAKVGKELALTTKRGDELIEVKVIAAGGKGGAKLVARASTAPKKEEPKPEPKAEKPDGKRPHLGVSVIGIDGGLRVEEVQKDTAAAAYGIRTGDVLKKVNGADTNDVSRLVALLGKMAAGDKITVLVSRDGKDVEIKDLILGAKGEVVEAPKAAAAPPAKKERKPGVLGVRAQETEGDQVEIVEVAAGGAAEKAGLKVGDIIVKVGDTAIKNFDNLAAALKGKFAGDALNFKIKRGDDELDIKLTLGEPGSEE